MELLVTILLYGVVIGILISAITSIVWCLNWLIIFCKDCFEKNVFLGVFISGLSIAVICVIVLYLISWSISKGR